MSTTLKPPYHPHDKGYKQLLSNKQTFLSLIKTFVRADWCDSIQEEDLTRVEKSYILQDFSQKEADIVYELKSGANNIIFYCLLELQSTVDFLMPFRLLQYMTEIWRDSFNNTAIRERESKEYRLPAIIPLVLYNGADSWTAARQFQEMVIDYEQFGNHLVNFSYILLDINRYDEDKLCEIANLMASVFLLDQTTKHSEEIIERLRKLVSGLQQLTPEQFGQLTVWLKNVLKPRVAESLRDKIDEILDNIKPEEVEMMISNIEITLQQDRLQAELKGRQEGRLEGKLEIARKMLLRGDMVVDIVEITGLSEADIHKLTQEIH